MAKYVSINEALGLVKDNDYIVTGLGSAEGREFMTNLHTIAGKVKNIMVSNCLPMGAYEFMTNPAYKDSFRTEGWFYTPVLRKAHANGMRSGVQSFALTWIYDSYNLPEGATPIHAAASATVHGLMSIEDYRKLLNE